jgi:hypothetical protein
MPTTITIGDLRTLSDAIPDETMRVYVVEGDGCVLYVGRSKDAVERMMSHLGLGNWLLFWGGDFDETLSRHRPHSDGYTVTFFSEEEVASLCKLPPKPSDRKDEHLWRARVDCVVSDLEEGLIYEMSPVFNCVGEKKDHSNRERWDSIYPPGIANEGVYL